MKKSKSQFQEAIERGKNILKSNPHLLYFEFSSQLAKFFPDKDNVFFKEIWNRVLADTPIIEIYGFDAQSFVARLNQKIDLEDLEEAYNNEILNIDNLFNDYKLTKLLLIKRISEFENEEIDDDIYYLFCDIDNKQLKEILLEIYFRCRECDLNLTEFLNVAENVFNKEINNYIEIITQSYLLNLSKIGNKSKNQGNGSNLKILGRQVDIVRIFEAMKMAGILSTKTEIKQIAQLFFNDSNNINKFVASYNAQKNRLKDYDSNSNSENLALFIQTLSKNLKIDDLQNTIRVLEGILSEKIKFK